MLHHNPLLQLVVIIATCNISCSLISNKSRYHIHVNYPCSYLLYSTRSGTLASCGIVAGAAALVLEKFPQYTPQQVKEYLINQSTLGIVQTSLDENELDFFMLER